MEYAIEFENVSKSFKGHMVLEDLNVNIVAGKITTILGFSGAGKTTMLKHILGLVEPTSGEVRVLGKSLSSFGAFQLREFRKNFGMLFQYAALFDSFTAFGNVAFPLKEFTDFDNEKISDVVKDLFASVGLEASAMNKLPSELSGGMRKRVGLARALALSPQIMLYDEPTTGLDPVTTKMVNKLIMDTADQNRQKGMTSVIISHDIKATLEVSDFVAFLHHGTIIEHAPVADFKKSGNPMVKKFIEM
jgi:phospholipid/cholesterol/gamma-HCH transport system ATP-binding protein